MKKQIIRSKSAPLPIGPYSQAILHTGTLYISGQIAMHPTNNALILSSIEDETNQVLQNIASILKEANMRLENVVKTTIFLADLNDFDRVNVVYSRFFSTNPPARETMEVSRLPKDVNVEISVIAML